MVTHRRPGPKPDEMITSSLHAIATRSWVPPAGTDRAARLDELREAAGGRTDLLIRVAGILLGLRVDDEYDPRFQVGRERRDRPRVRPQHGW